MAASRRGQNTLWFVHSVRLRSHTLVCADLWLLYYHSLEENITLKFYET